VRHIGAVTWIVYGLAAVAMVLPVTLLVELVRDGAGLLSWHFLTAGSETLATGGGVGPELFNTVYVVGVAMVLSLPVGLAIAVLRREYWGGTPQGQLLEALTDFAAGMPSVVVGFLVFVLLVASLGWPFSRGAGVVALFIVNLPWVASAGMVFLHAVPESLREASVALGASRWETVRRVVLPTAAPGLAGALTVAAARLAGESAALLFTTGINASGASWSWWAPGATLAVHLFSVRTEGLMPDAVAVSAATGLTLLALVLAVLMLGGAAARWFQHRSGVL
jgi:phosphate transport system permease protein